MMELIKLLFKGVVFTFKSYFVAPAFAFAITPLSYSVKFESRLSLTLFWNAVMC